MAKGGGDTKMAEGKAAQNKATKSGTAQREPGKDDPDDALWHRVAGTIKPLKSRRRPPPQSKPPAPPAPDAVDAKPRAIVQKPALPAKPPLPELTPGVARGVDKRTAQRLGRGLLAIDARLDLHGLTQDEAHGRLAGFIRRSVAAGHRCVLVITGKGYKTSYNKMGGESGVLRQAVPRWLNESGLRRDIVALRHAQPKDGGEGALYVFLKRDRTAGPSGKDAPPPKRLTRIRRS